MPLALSQAFKYYIACVPFNGCDQVNFVCLQRKEEICSSWSHRPDVGLTAVADAAPSCV